MTLPSVETQRGRLRRLLKEARKALGMTQGQLGEKINYGQPSISKFEKSEAALPPSTLERLISGLEVDPATAAEMRALNEASEPARVYSEYRLTATPTWFRAMLEAEAEAQEVLSWTGERMNGQLQVESYMLEQFMVYRRTDVYEAVHERKQRSRLFEEHPDRSYRFIFSQATLKRLIHAPTVNAFVALDQVKHLLKLIDTYDNVSIRILPWAVPVHVGGPEQVIFRFADRGPFAYGETTDGVKQSSKDNFDAFVKAWDSVSSVALPEDKTKRMLERAAELLADPQTLPTPEETDPLG